MLDTYLKYIQERDVDYKKPRNKKIEMIVHKAGLEATKWGQKEKEKCNTLPLMKRSACKKIANEKQRKLNFKLVCKYKSLCGSDQECIKKSLRYC